MRRFIIAGLLTVMSLSGLALAEAEFDFEELMEAVEDDTHELQATIVAEDADASLALTNKLDGAFKLVEGYFATWGDAQDAVDDAKRYQKKLAEVVAALQRKDFRTASDHAVEFAKSCDKACHDKYKPL